MGDLISLSEAVVMRCSGENVSLIVLQNAQGNTSVGVHFLTKLQDWTEVVTTSKSK